MSVFSVVCCQVEVSATGRSGDQIKKTEMGRICSTYEKSRDVYRVLTRNPEGRRSLGRPRHRWENNIKIDIREVGRRHGLDQSGSK